MYREEKSMVLKSSTSALGNNLSIHINLERKTINYAVVHRSTVNLVNAYMDGSTVNHKQVVWKEPTTTSSTGIIIQAKLLSLSNRSVLVLAAQKGIQIYESDGAILLHYHSLDEDSAKGSLTPFAKGVANVGDVIFVGDNKGQILCFQVNPKNGNVRLLNICKGHSSAVSCLDAQESIVASGDDNGDIFIWEFSASNSLNTKMRLKGQGYPCTSLCIWRDLIVASYGSGHIRIWSISDGNLRIEAAAHAKWINAIDIARSNGMLLSVSEDTFVRVWQITSGAEPKLEHLWCSSVTNVQLQGGAFLTQDGRAFGATGYDSNEVYFFKR